MRALTFAIMLFFPAISYAESGPDICKAALDKYNGVMNSMPVQQAFITHDQSVSGHTDKKMEILYDMVAAQINLQLLVANKCPLPVIAADANPDPVGSVGCASALIQQDIAMARSGESPNSLPDNCEKLKAK